MDNSLAALLELLIVGGIGCLLVIFAVVLYFSQKNKAKNCTSTINGQVIKYRFQGEGRMYPVVSYQVAGKSYLAVRRFRGFITKKKVTPEKIYEGQGAYVTDNDYLYVPMSAITNLKAMAQVLWPLGSQMTVYYNPARPKQAYVEKVSTKVSTETIITFWMGIGLIVFSVLMAFLIGH